MGTPTIGVVIATPGRKSLLRTLNSIRYQNLIAGDDVIIVGDGYHRPTDELVSMLGAPFRYVATTKTRDWGHSQVNYGLKQVKGDWIILQDDDDIFLPRAFDEIRKVTALLDEPRPIIGRVITPFLGILWQKPGSGPLDGHCLVVPNDKKKLGYMGLEYAGDQKWLSSNLEAYDTYTWADRIWSFTRPTQKLWPQSAIPVFSDPTSWAWTFHEDKDGLWGDALCKLDMSMLPNVDYWDVRITMMTGRRMTVEQAMEVAEFAAWAGQGCDVWLRIPFGDRLLTKHLVAFGYKFHQMVQDDMEFVFEWPPHRFGPPVKEDDD